MDDLAGVAQGAFSAFSGLRDEAEAVFTARDEAVIQRPTLPAASNWRRCRNLPPMPGPGTKGACMSFTTFLIVMTGGAFGTLARYIVSVLALPISCELPCGTLLINVSGSFIIGLFGTLTLAHGRYPVSENVRLFVMIGLCGGYTTFSSFSLQTLDLLRGGAIVRAAINIGASVILCIVAVALGHSLAAHFNESAKQVAQLSIEEEG
jgi:fluoride exporter